MKTFTVDITSPTPVTLGIMVFTHPRHGNVVELGQCMNTGDRRYVRFSRSRPPRVVDGCIFEAHPYRPPARSLGHPFQCLMVPSGHRRDDQRALILLMHFDEFRSRDGGELNLVNEGTFMLFVMSTGRVFELQHPAIPARRFRLSYTDPMDGPQCVELDLNGQPSEQFIPTTA
ncbi:MAG: hypothetical protein HY567_01580 [Candidatus Kerfeldbacteria bacterium]|nr:hypothetical protein [Candidatus Kerfeldbacteria bacterium]